MRVRMLYRQVQRVPFEKLYLVRELDKKMDEAEGKLGFPRPRRCRSFTSGEMSQTRVQEREFSSVADFGRLMAAWAEDETCQRLEVEKKNYMEWERNELYYVDDPAEPVVPWLQMAAEQEPKRTYEINEDYLMPKEQKNYRG